MGAALLGLLMAESGISKPNAITPKSALEFPAALLDRYDALAQENPQLGWFSRTHFAVDAFREKLDREEDRVLRLRELRSLAEEGQVPGPRKLGAAGIRAASDKETAAGRPR